MPAPSATHPTAWAGKPKSSTPNVTENSYDSNGNQLTSKVMDASGTVLLSNQSEYNSKNQLVKNIDAEGNVTRYEYDARGNKTTYQYDGENRLVKTIDPLGGETVYEYDINGNHTKVISPNGATTPSSTTTSTSSSGKPAPIVVSPATFTTCPATGCEPQMPMATV